MASNRYRYLTPGGAARFLVDCLGVLTPKDVAALERRARAIGLNTRALRPQRGETGLMPLARELYRYPPCMAALVRDVRCTARERREVHDLNERFQRRGARAFLFELTWGVRPLELQTALAEMGLFLPPDSGIWGVAPPPEQETPV